jgi:hypothetical protein
MDDTHDAEPEESPYIRLPWPLVAAALGGVLLLALGLGLYANRYLRPQVGIVPTPIATAAAAPAPASTVVPTPAPTLLITPAPTSVSVPLSPPPTSGPTISPSSANSTPFIAPTIRPTVSPDLVDELGNAYQHYWDIRAVALLDLDSSRLSEVMAGDHLVAVEKLIEQLRTEGHALLTDVDHKYAIVSASADEAEIADTYTDSSVYVDPSSHEVLSQPANDVLQEQYRMTRIDGTWRVVSLVRAP